MQKKERNDIKKKSGAEQKRETLYFAAQQKDDEKGELGKRHAYGRFKTGRPRKILQWE